MQNVVVPQQIWLYELIGGTLPMFLNIPQCEQMEDGFKYIAFYF